LTEISADNNSVHFRLSIPEFLKSPWVIFFAAVVVRLILIWKGPEPAHDDGAYMTAVLRYFNGQGLTYLSEIWGPEKLLYSWLPPGYGILVILYFKIFSVGFSLFPLRLFITLLGCFSCLLLYFIGKDLRGKNFGLLAGYGLAFYPPMALDSTAINPHPIAIFMFLVMVFLLLLSRGKWGKSLIFLAGIAAGATALTRGEYFTANLWIVLWLVFIRRTGVQPASFWRWPSKKDLLAGAMAGFVFLAGLAFIMSPWVIRNWRIHHKLILLSTNYGDNIYFPFNPAYNFSGNSNYYQMDQLRTATKNMSETEMAQYLANKAFTFIKENPGKSFKTIVFNFLHFWRPWLSLEKYSLSKSLFYTACYLPLFILFLIGLFHVKWRGDSAWLLFGGIILIKNLSHIFFYIIVRFRETLVPYIILFAVAGLIWLLRKNIKRPGRH